VTRSRMTDDDPGRHHLNSEGHVLEAVDGLSVYGEVLASRLMLGTALYPSPAVLEVAVRASGAGVVTVSLRREQARGQTGSRFIGMVREFVRELGVKVLPNTAGCRSAKEAIVTAQMARELFETDWIKLEVIANDDTLQPDVFGLVEAADVLGREGFKILPYTTEDLSVADRLIRAGCDVLMPWGAPIGSGRGLNNVYGLRTLRAYAKGIVLVVDAGLGAPSHAAAAMELGFDACLLNTAVAKAVDPAAMARAFAQGIAAGRTAYLAGIMEPRDMASPSTPLAGTPFFDLDTG
jgi:thiazole synthase